MLLLVEFLLFQLLLEFLLLLVLLLLELLAFLVLLFFLSTCSFTTAQTAPLVTPTRHQASYDQLFSIHKANMEQIQPVCEARKSDACLILINDLSEIVADAQAKNNNNALIGDDQAAFHKAFHSKLLALEQVLFKMLTPEELNKIKESGLQCPACKTRAASSTPALKPVSARADRMDPCSQCYLNYLNNAAACAVITLVNPILGLACIVLNELTLSQCEQNSC